MAHARIQLGAITDSTNQTSTSGYSFNHIVESQGARALIVCIGARDTTTTGDTVVSSVTFGGAPMSEARSEVTGGGGTVAVRSSVWVLNNPPSGSAAVAVTFAATVNQSRAVTFALWNVDQTTSQDVAAVGTAANAANPTLSITPVTDRAFLVGSHFRSGFEVVSPASGQTEIVNLTDSSTYRLHVCTKEVEVPGATAMNLTAASNKYGYVIIALRPRRRRVRTS